MGIQWRGGVKMAKVVTIGESMIIFQTMQIGNLEDQLYVQQKVGGAESNYAVGLARLGNEVKYMSQVGDDPFGKKILKTIRAEGVNVAHLTVMPNMRTGLLFKEQSTKARMNVYYYRDRSAASYMSTESLPEDFFEGTVFFHVTGITPAISESCRALIFAAIEKAKNLGVKIIFDPNIRFKLWKKEQAFKTLNELVDLADYVLAGEDEGAFLTNETNEQKMCEILSRNESKIVILKRGHLPTLIFAEGAFKEVPTQKVEHILDTVGAGDAFAAGFTHGLLNNYSLEESVCIGNIAGACVIQQFGDIEGLPTLQQLQQLLSEEKTSDVLR